MSSNKRRKLFVSIQEMVIFAMWGAVMYCSKVIMEWVPNIHLLGMFTMTFTICYRVKALIPIYIYILLNGFFSGFALWWIPYLYIWTVLWGITMLLPKKLPAKFTFIYPVICGLHGLAFGTLYAPAQALMFHLNFKQMIAWIAAGLPFDFVHAIGNFAAGFLIFPLVKLLRRIDPNCDKGYCST